jgi:hypothetical protein
MINKKKGPKGPSHKLIRIFDMTKFSTIDFVLCPLQESGTTLNFLPVQDR